MSTIITKFICSAIMSITGLIIMKRICTSNEKIFSIKSMAFILCLIIQSAYIYDKDYTYFYTILSYFFMVISYKYVLNISIQKSIIGCGIMMISIIFLEVVGSCILVPFFSADTVRNTWYINFFGNLVFSLILLAIFFKTKFGVWISKMLINIESKKYIRVLIFLILSIIAMSILLYSLTKNFKFNKMFTNDFFLFIIFFLLIIILFDERNSYDRLVNDYDNLFDYVKIFEEWIEKEQFIRHEYKNQLAVLRCMTKEKNVKDKIDSIIAESINIDGDVINELKYIPNGGIKGLIYYKVAIAKNKKADVEIDVSSTVTKYFKKLNKNQIELLSKLLGVYCDNAIEAAVDNKHRLVSIEVYTEGKNLVFVISNTYNRNNIIFNSSDKGISSKGPGRGNGLYFARKLLLKNKWIKSTTDISRNFYIQRIEVSI